MDKAADDYFLHDMQEVPVTVRSLESLIESLAPRPIGPSKILSNSESLKEPRGSRHHHVTSSGYKRR